MRLPVPAPLHAYYILHVDNLQAVLRSGGLLSDRAIRDGEVNHENIGMDSVKERRLVRPVTCHPGTFVGEYVPFYLCPRSIMLFVIHRANHSDLLYRGGQGPIVHLEFDVARVVAWANSERRPWAASYGNAATDYADFATGPGTMARMNWDAIRAHWFRDAAVHDAKQSEFLVFGHVPWHLVDQIGVLNQSTKQKAAAAVESAGFRTPVVIQRDWYYL